MQPALKAPARLTGSGLQYHARQPETRRRLIDAAERLEHDLWDLPRIERFKKSTQDRDNYLEIAILAHAAAELMQPERALEVGVRRGFTSSLIASAHPPVELHLMDSWRGEYAHQPNPGPPLVRRQLAASGHGGGAVFHQGNSHLLLPQLFAAQPELAFNILIVDGDHTEAGAEQDLTDTFPHVACGGVLLFDDLTHPTHPYLLNVWNRWQARLAGSFEFGAFLDEGMGVGWAIRL